MIHTEGIMDKGVETKAPEESPAAASAPGYLECIDSNCEYYGLVKIPKSRQRYWGEDPSGEINEFAGIRDAECPGCHSTRTVHLAEELAPDIHNPESVDQWLKEYVRKPHVSYEHLPYKQQLKNTAEQAKLYVEAQLNKGAPDEIIKQELVEYVSQNPYPNEL